MQMSLTSFYRFCSLTAISFAINFGLTALLHEVLAVPEALAFAAALAVVFVINFFMQRYYVYSARSGKLNRQLFLFFCSTLGFRGAEYAAFLAASVVLDVHYLIAIIGVTGTSFVIKFFYYGTLVFRGAQAE